MFEAKQIQFINLLNRLIQIFVLNDIFKNDLIFLFTVVLDLHRCADFSLVAASRWWWFSHSVMSNSLRPNEL